MNRDDSATLSFGVTCPQTTCSPHRGQRNSTSIIQSCSLEIVRTQKKAGRGGRGKERGREETSVVENVGERELLSSSALSVEMQISQPLGKSVWRFLRKLRIELYHGTQLDHS